MIGQGRPTSQWKWAVVLAVVLCAVCAVASRHVAEAHANLVASEPPAAGQVAAMPNRLTLEYSEGVVSISVQVIAEDGTNIAASAVIDRTDARHVIVPVRDSGSGVYTVSWSAQSVDGHDTSGAYFFSVGDAVPSIAQIRGATAVSTTSALTATMLIEWVARAVLFTGIVVILGAALTAQLVAPEFTETVAGSRVMRRVLIIGGVALVLGACLLGAKQSVAAGGVDSARIASFIVTGQGLAAIARVGCGAVVIVVAWCTSGRSAALVSAVFGCCAALSVSLVSHSGTLISGLGPVAVDAGHLLFGALWVGGLFLLAVAIPVAIRQPSTDVTVGHLGRAARKFSAIAIAGAGIAIASGLMLASWHAGGPTELLTTPYGIAMVTKATLVGGAVILGALNRLRFTDALEASGWQLSMFRRSVGAEIAAVAVALVLSAFMTSAQTGTAHLAAQPRQPIVQAASAGPFNVTLTVTPGRPGVNVFDAAVYAEHGILHQADAIRLLLELPSEDLALDELRMAGGHGSWSVVSALGRPGDWHARVLVEANGKVAAARFAFNAESPAPATYETRSDLASPLRWVSGSVAALAFMACVIEIVTAGRIGRRPVAQT